MNSLIICIMAGVTGVSLSWGLYYLIVDRPNLVSLINHQTGLLLRKKDEYEELKKKVAEIEKHFNELYGDHN